MAEEIPPLYRILKRLEAAKIHHDLKRVRDETVMIQASVPGRRYEIEVFEDGHLEIEVFESRGHIGGIELLDELLHDFNE